MVVLGLLLLAASVGAAVSIAVSNTDSMSFDVFGQKITSLSAGGLMLLGIALGVAALVGLWLMSAGMRHNRRRREADRHAVVQTRSRVDELEEENIRLRRVAERNAAAATPASTTDYQAPESEPMMPADRGIGGTADQSRPVATPATDGPAAYHQPGPNQPGEDRTVDLDGGTRTSLSTGTPAFEQTAHDQGNRVFGRRST